MALYLDVVRWQSSLRVLLLNAFFNGRKEPLTVVVNEHGFVSKVKVGIYKDLCRDAECVDLTAYGLAVPGFIDLHAHLRGLDLSYKEDEISGSKAAARGGYTAIIDMPNTIPRIDHVKALELKLERLSKGCFVDFGVSVTPPQSGDIEELRKLIERPEVMVIGEIFPEDLHLLQVVIKAVEVTKVRKVVMIHPESVEFVDECEKGLRWICRPLEAEVGAISFVNKVVEQYGGSRLKIHVTHVTNPMSLIYAKHFGFTVDTAPHYIYLSSDDEFEKGCIAKVNPPLRHSTTRDAMQYYIKYLDAVATDHAPHSIAEKQVQFSKCPSGISSIEIASSLMLNLVSKGVIELQDAIRLLSIGPAKILEIGEKWGCFKPKCIASYTVINLDKEFTIDSSKFYSKAQFTPYEGMKIRGVVEATIVRGTLAQLDGEIMTAKPLGKPLGDLIWH
jgi:dihydroorotase